VRHVAALGVASLALLAFASPHVDAKKAPEVTGKRAAAPNALRTIDIKQDEPGPAFARQWDGFTRQVAAKRPAGKAPVFGNSDLFVRFSGITGAPRVVYGDLGEAPAAAKRSDRAMLFIEANAHVFGVDPSQLVVARSFEAPDEPGHYYYDQKYQGLPVFYGEVAVHINTDGRVWAVTNTFAPVSIASTRATVTPDAAFDAALEAVGITASSLVAEFPTDRTLGVWPTSDGGRLAYRVRFSSRNPAGYFETVVDANTGEILAEPINQMCMVDGQGAVFTPSPVVSEGINNLTDATVIPDSYYKATTLLGLDGSGKLIGPYSQVHPSMSNPAIRANNNFSDLRRTTNQFDEEEVYWAIDLAARTYQALGFAPSGNMLMNYPIKVYAHNSPTWGNQDNSSFTGSQVDGPGTGILEFGTGGVDDAQDAEIIWHEYGHATLYNQRPGISQNISQEGLGEGWGDYLAGAMSQRTIGASNYYVTVGEWDAVSYNPGNPAFLRRLDNAAFWHGNGSEVHDAGETWSHPLFDYDQQVGTNVGLRVALQANFLMDLSPTQAEGYAAMISADQMLYGGATAGLINNAFGERHTPLGTGGPVATVVPVVHTVGVGIPATGTFFLRNSATPGNADVTLVFGGGTATQLVGDWNGNGSDTIGLYDPTTGNFFLKNTNTPGNADIVFGFGAGGPDLLPLVGDWDGNGTETVGLYNRVTGFFFLKNSNAGGPADLVFSFGAGGLDVLPVVGDWDGNGTDTVAIYNQTTGAFFLRNANSSGGADVVFQFGAGGVGIVPVAGDFNADNVNSVGLYNAATGVFFLKNTNAPGAADYTVAFGPAGGVPLVGDFNGGMHPINQ
jgi:hypothetical protein